MSLRMPILLILVGRLLGATALKRSFKRRRGFGQDAQAGLSRSHIVEWQACTGRIADTSIDLDIREYLRVALRAIAEVTAGAADQPGGGDFGKARRLGRG